MQIGSTSDWRLRVKKESRTYPAQHRFVQCSCKVCKDLCGPFRSGTPPAQHPSVSTPTNLQAR